MKKEPKFHTEEEFIDHVTTYKPIRNTKNFKFFTFNKIGKKLHLNRWLLVQDDKNNLMIKYYTYEPLSKVIAYADTNIGDK